MSGDEPPPDHAKVTTPVFSLDFSGRDTVVILLFAGLVAGAGYVSYRGQQEIVAEHDRVSADTIRALNNLATEQRFTTCVLWVVADRSIETKQMLDEALLKQRCWWIRKESGAKEYMP